jgi:hypothetical protein
MGFTALKHGFTDPQKLFKAIAQDLYDGGMTLIASDLPPADISIILDTVKVYYGTVEIPRIDSLTGSENWTLDNPTFETNSIGVIVFSQEILAILSVQPALSAQLFVDFDFMMDPVLVENEPLVGKVKSVPTVFTSSDASVNLASIVLYINDIVVPQEKYTVILNSSKRAQFTIDPNNIPKSTFNITADYTVDGNHNLFGINIMGKSRFLPDITYDVQTKILTITKFESFLSYNSNGGSFINIIDNVVDIQLTYWNPGYATVNKVLTLPAPTTTSVVNSSGKITCTYNLTNVSGLTGTVLDVFIFAITNGTGSSLLDPAQPWSTTNPRYYSTILNIESHMINKYVKKSLVGPKDGYNDTFFTNPKNLKIEDTSTIVVRVTGVDGTTTTVQEEGTMYVATLNPSGTAKIVFDADYVPVTGSTLFVDYYYRPLNKDTHVAGAILIGDRNSVNTRFSIASRLFGTKWTFEASKLIDPLWDTQPWRIHIDSAYELKFNSHVELADTTLNNSLETILEYGRIVVGTPYQLLDTGEVLYYPSFPLAKYEDYYKRYYETNLNEFLAYLQSGDQTKQKINVGQLLNAENKFETFKDTLGGTTTPRFSDGGFLGQIAIGEISPIISQLEINPGVPNSYQVCVSDHGIAVSINNEAHPIGSNGRFFAVQRLVDAVTGELLLDRKSPVFCIFSQIERNYIYKVGELADKFTRYFKEGMTKIYQIVVRESDVMAPSAPKEIQKFSEYVGAGFNAHKQISIAEDGSYIITIPDGLTTNRHLWHNKRPDMIAFCSALLLASQNVAKVNLHDERDELGNKIMRTYTAQNATIGYQEGMRLLLLTDKGGI